MQDLTSSFILSPTLKNCSIAELEALAIDLRAHLISEIEKGGGHLGASLGVTELTLACHAIYNPPKDKLIWDVGHQSQIHKLLTGRTQLHTQRKKNGIAPFLDPAESPYDPCVTGHASTSISLGLGMAIAESTQKNPSKIIAIIGDGSFTGGLSYEALNHAGSIQASLLVIYNDNGMSISPNVGALAKGNKLKAWVSAMGWEYTGPLNGHSLPALLKTLNQLKTKAGPQFLHIKTQKGKGLKAIDAETHSHAITASKPTIQENESTTSFSNALGKWALKRAETDAKLIIITPAMIIGSGLSTFQSKYPNRCIDVGICESHAVTLAAGLAKAGMKPVVAIYSTFMQRAIDQLIHDVGIPNLPVIFAVDRAGCVGPDGMTHMGAFDMALTQPIPNFELYAPSTPLFCESLLERAYLRGKPALVRYPKAEMNTATQQLLIGQNNSIAPRILREGKSGAALINFGALLEECVAVSHELDMSLIDIQQVKPLDVPFLLMLASKHKYLVTVEDHVIIGGCGSEVRAALAQHAINLPLLTLGIPDRYIQHATRAEQLQECGLDSVGIIQQIKNYLSEVSS